MKIAVMAAGAVGGYFGVRLAEAGHDVVFIARGKHLEAIRSQGLKVRSELGDVHIPNANATDDTASVGPVDVILFAVKLWDTTASARACKQMLADNTTVISLQNGVESSTVIAEKIGAKHALAGTAQVSSVIAEPGVIQHFGNFAKLVFGESNNQISDRARNWCEFAGRHRRAPDGLCHQHDAAGYDSFNAEGFGERLPPRNSLVNGRSGEDG